MQYACCAGPDQYWLLERLGYHYIELPAKMIAAMEESAFCGLARTIESGRVKCRNLNAYCGPELIFAGPGFDLKLAEDYALKLMPRARKLGVEAVGIGSPLSRILPPGFAKDLALAQFRSFLQETSRIASQNGIEVLIEAVREQECNFITTTREALALSEELGFRMVYDVYHAIAMREDIAPLVAAFPRVGHIHVSSFVEADDPRMEHGHLTEESCLVLQPYIYTAMRLGYCDIISVEAFLGDIAEGAKSSIQIMRDMERDFRL